MPVSAVIASRLGLAGNMNRSKVRRCLFGMPNHDEIRRELNKQLEQINQDIRTKWNYDAELDQPMTGRIEWSVAQNAPEFYTRPCRPTRFAKRRCLDLESDVNEQHSDSDSDSVADPPQIIDVRLTESAEDVKSESMDMKRENETTPEARVVKQSRIPDFMKKRKRPSSENGDSDVGPSRPAKSLRI